MSVTVVGSIAYDAVTTPFGVRERMLGGAATHFALAASFFDAVRPVGPVGGDFAEADLAILRTRGTSTDDVQVLLARRVRVGSQHPGDAGHPAQRVRGLRTAAQPGRPRV